MTRTKTSGQQFVRRLSLVIPIFLCSIPLTCQVVDDFSDGNFSTNPSWSGDTEHFTITSSGAVPSSMHPVLKLDAEGTDTSYLSVAGAALFPVEWRFWIKLSFNPSANNFARVYLSANNPNLKEPLQGYFLQFGGVNDSLILFRQTGNVAEPLMQAMHAYCGNSTNVFRVKVTYSDSGQWQLYADPTGGSNFIQEGSCMDPAGPNGNFFGIVCRYTASNASKFYFDDVVVGHYLPDTLPPLLSSVEVLSPLSLDLEFSEPLDPVCAINVLHYNISPGIGNPVQASTTYPDYHRVTLELEVALEEGLPYLMNLENLCDVHGNVLGGFSSEFQYIDPGSITPFDLLINEIMADPVPPPVAVPAAEYLELFNPTNYAVPLDLFALRTSSASGLTTLPTFSLGSGEYILITDAASGVHFEGYGPVLTLENFSLPNEGFVELQTVSGTGIHRVDYDRSTYSNAAQSDGGWSLEQVDPYLPCSRSLNWTSCVDPKGGTPGKINSVDADNPVPFELKIVYCSSDTSLIMELNMSLNPFKPLTPEQLFVDGGIGVPAEVIPLDTMRTRYALLFANGFLPQKIYQLRITGVENCIGQPIAGVFSFEFGKEEAPEWNDVVINEVLFNPRGTGVDYVELYNRSAKHINLEYLKIGHVKEDQVNDPDTTYREVSLENKLLLKGRYAVLTIDPDEVLEDYPGADLKSFVLMESMPPLPDDAGNLVLESNTGEIIDGMEYNEEMHHPLLWQVEGVSLERIHPDRPSSDPGNWHSASSFSGYGTPGAVNSQFAEFAGKEEGILLVEPKVFSPDNDGFEDVVVIRLAFPDAGYVSTLLIFDSDGRHIKTLLNNELCGPEAVIHWDGTTELRKKVPVGIYIALLESFHPDGAVVKEKQAVVVTGRIF